LAAHAFVEELRMLTDRAYPGWEPKQRLEMARFHFVQGVCFSTTQLALMKEKPSSLAQTHEAVEAAQKQLQSKQSVALVHQSPEESGTCRRSSGDKHTCPLNPWKIKRSKTLEGNIKRSWTIFTDQDY